MVEKDKRITIRYEELEGKDYTLVGKKNANLGEMLKANIPVAPGFALTIHANDIFITQSGVKAEIAKYIKSLGQVSYEKSLQASKFTVDLIENATIPAIITDEVFKEYQNLCELAGTNNVPVAVRSSGAISMPGQMETYLNIRGQTDLETYIKKTWASAYFIEAITYRMNKDMGFLLNIGVGIPKMVNSRVSGIVFTLNPLNGDKSKISVDVSYGLGEAVVSGMVTPDNYLLDKITMEVISCNVGSKECMCVYEDDGSCIKTIEVPEDQRGTNCINQKELMEVCRIAKSIDRYYGKPYDIEFAIDADLSFPDNVIILQVRPESVWAKKQVKKKTVEKKDAMHRIVGNLLTGARVK
jgi:pyruvate,water dikinase